MIFEGPEYVLFAGMALAMLLVCVCTSRQLAAQDRTIDAVKLELDAARSRIAQDRELALSAGHALACLCVQLTVAKKFQSRDRQKTEVAVDAARSLAGESLDIVRELVASTAQSRPVEETVTHGGVACQAPVQQSLAGP